VRRGSWQELQELLDEGRWGGGKRKIAPDAALFTIDKAKGAKTGEMVADGGLGDREERGELADAEWAIGVLDDVEDLKADRIGEDGKAGAEGCGVLFAERWGA
jgi:hypothetical protein